MTKLTSEIIEQRLKTAIKNIYACNIKYSEKVGIESEQQLCIPASKLMINNFVKKVGCIPNTYKLFLEAHNGYKYYKSTEAHLLSTEDFEKKWLNKKLKEKGKIFYKSENAKFGVISDIDDTILKTDVLSTLKWKIFYNTLFIKAYLKEFVTNSVIIRANGMAFSMSKNTSS